MVSGLMNWKARRSEFFSGTRNVLPRMVISTSFSYGRKISSIRGVLTSAIGLLSPAIETKAPREREQSKQGREVFNAPMGKGLRSGGQGGGRSKKRRTSRRSRASVLARVRSRDAARR